MKGKAKLITVLYTDGRREQFTEEPQLDRLQNWVGGYIELIPWFKRFEGNRLLQVYGNEDGKHLNLPVNAVATAAWHDEVIRFGKATPADKASGRLDDLLGNIVLVQVGGDQ
jgi:Domain of unknown function (DUF3846)